MVTGMGLSHRLCTKERARSRQTGYIQVHRLNDEHKNLSWLRGFFIVLSERMSEMLF